MFFEPVTVENLELIGKLYRALDKNENNYLDAGDFHDADPNIDTYLQQIWHTIRENFDFDGDGTISQVFIYHSNKCIKTSH